MFQVRIINIPPLSVVSSGPITTIEEMEAFDGWWSKIEAKNYITPRDFMYFNEEKNCMEWIFAMVDGQTDTGGYEISHFPGGLYAVGTTKNTDEASKESKEYIYNWVNESEVFELSTTENDPVNRYDMFHVSSPEIFNEKMGYHLSEIYVPIVVK